MAKKPKLPKTPHPSDANGDFASKGGENIYTLLWGLQGRVSRLEAGFAIIILLLGTVLGKLFEVIP